MHRFRVQILVAVVLLLAVGNEALARRGAEPPRPSRSTVRRVARMGLPLPILRQNTIYSCGAASYMSVLQMFKGYDGREQQLYRSLGTNPRTGTEPERIVRRARRDGFKAELRQGLTVKDLRSAVKQGKAVILDLQAWRDPHQQKMSWDRIKSSGHYVALKAVGNKYIYFMDPSAGPDYAYLPISELMPRWHDHTLNKDGTYRNYKQSAIVIDPAGAKPRRGPGLIHMD
jgi:predicted double-glycine peptidase